MLVRVQNSIPKMSNNGMQLENLESDRLEQIADILLEDIQSVQLNQEGVDNLIVEVNRHWIFRFPRNERARINLQKNNAFY